MIGAEVGGLVAQVARHPGTEVPMEAWILLVIVLGLIVFDVLALRFGVDSRPEWDNPHNWS